MNQADQFLLSTSLIYLGVDILAVWGLNLQFGICGILSFAFILFQAIGAYLGAVFTLGPDTANGAFQTYTLGLHLPFIVAVIAAALSGAALALPMGFVVLRKLRADYQAIALLVISIIASVGVITDTGLFNGSAGISLIPRPLPNRFSLIGWQWFYVGLVGAICLLVYVFVVRRITGSPLGRSLRAIRENEQAAAALGTPVFRLKLFVLSVGGGIGALSGALLGPFITTWAPSMWLFPETFVLLGAIIIGGRGNDFGAALGALVFPVLIVEGSTFLPQFGPLGLTAALQWVVVGLLILLFLWFRPQGIVPERRRRFRQSVDADDREGIAG